MVVQWPQSSPIVFYLCLASELKETFENIITHMKKHLKVRANSCHLAILMQHNCGIVLKENSSFHLLMISLMCIIMVLKKEHLIFAHFWWLADHFCPRKLSKGRMKRQGAMNKQRKCFKCSFKLKQNLSTHRIKTTTAQPAMCDWVQMSAGELWVVHCIEDSGTVQKSLMYWHINKRAADGAWTSLAGVWIVL